MLEQKSDSSLFQKKAAPEPLNLREFIVRVRSLFSWLYKEIYEYRRIFFGSWLLRTILSMASASPIIIIKKIVEDFPKESNSFALSLGLLAGAIVFISLLEIIGTLSAGYINFKLRHSIEIQFARHLSLMPLSFYENNTSGNVSLAPFTQIPLLTNVIQIILRNFLQAGTTVFVVILILFYFQVSIGFFAFLLIPLFFIGANKLSKKLQRNMTHIFGQLSRLHSSLLENLVAVKSIRTLGISESRIHGIFKIVQDTLKAEIKTLLLSGYQQLILECVFAGGAVFLVYLLRSFFLDGSITLAECTALVAGFGLLVREVKKMANGLVELRKIVGASSEIIDFLNYPVESYTKASFVPKEKIAGIKLDKVGFAYNEKDRVFDSLNMFFPAGCITGIIGESGIGKSTIADLILRLRKPGNGNIFLNDKNLSVYSETWLRNNFGFADQEPFLFNTTIRENFLIAKNDLTEDEIKNALQAASALNFVLKLPEGLDSYVGEGGALLSVGEKQRIALARVLAKKPHVLVLDEITSSLDIENEKIVLQALKKLSDEMLLILITHKDSVASICSRIYTLETGKAVLLKDGESHVI